VQNTNDTMCECVYIGWQINHLDLAPRYAGVLVGITMTAGMLAGVINPLIIAALVKHQVGLSMSRMAFAHCCSLGGIL